MKALVEYRSGLMLIIPKEGHAPLLFLEWRAQQRAGANIVHKIIDNEPGVIKIRLNVLKEDYLNAQSYINANI